MALIRNNVVPLTRSADAFGTGALTIAAFTPGAGVRLEVKVWAMPGSNAAEIAGADITVTDSMGPLGQTLLHQTLTTDSPGWAYAMKAVLLDATTGGGSMTLTFDAGAFNIQNYWYQVDAITGEDAASPLGATAKGTDADGDGPASLTLSAAPAASSIVVAMAMSTHDNTAGSIDPGSGWTEEGDNARNGWGGAHVMSRTGSTSTAVDFGDLNVGGTTPLGAAMMAFEIKAAGGTTQDLAGAAAGQATASGAAAVGKPLGGAAAGAAAGTANLSKTDTLAGSAQGQASASGQLLGGATITSKVFKNRAGTVLSGLLIEKWTAIRLSDFVQICTWSNQTSNGSGQFSLTHVSLVAGVAYLLVESNADGSARGLSLYTAA